MRMYDYSFLRNKPIPNETMSLLVAIEKIRSEGIIFEVKYPEVFNNLEQIAIVQSIKYSNEIEGIITTDKRIRSIVNDNVAPINHDEEEIVGYRDVLDQIHNNHNEYQFNETDILAFHEILLSYTGFAYGGEYKKNDNVIIERDNSGLRRVRFRPTSAKNTKTEMEQLILAYMDARDDSMISNLLLIPSVVLDFLCIHPFSDGNGRMSRLLSLLLLYKENYIVGKYVSFEGFINDGKVRYYESLRLSSEYWHDNDNNYFYFIDNFLQTLLKCYQELYKRFEMISGKKDNKKSRIKETIFSSKVAVSRSDIHNIWPDISHETIKKVIKDLLKNDEIIKIGNFKDAKYKKK